MIHQRRTSQNFDKTPALSLSAILQTAAALEFFGSLAFRSKKVKNQKKIRCVHTEKRCFRRLNEKHSAGISEKESV